MSYAHTPELMVSAAALAVVAAAGSATVAAFAPQSQLFGKTLIASNDPQEAALTFDDGPNDRCTLKLLEVLARYNARATFFMVGRHVRARPDLVRAVAAAGHLIGNHTETHPWLTFKPAAVIRAELTTCKAALEDVLGQPVRYFRPPHGARRPTVLSIAAELGMTTVQWNAMAQDWRDITAMSMSGNTWRGINAARKRGVASNILLHDGDGMQMGADRSRTLQITDRLLAGFLEDSTRTVAVDAWS